LTRAAKTRRVFFFEEPIFDLKSVPRLELSYPHAGITVATPHLPHGQSDAARTCSLRQLLDQLIAREGIDPYVLWYYTPMALRFSDHLAPMAIIYDCMDQLAAFAGAPAELTDLERQLLAVSDAVFTGGPSLFEVKQPLHANVHCFPSSVDVAHFATARAPGLDPADQASIAHPRLGYSGVIDERLDLPLIAAVAKARPSWQIVLVGPVAKISASSLPLASNIHYLGGKRYQDLPRYVAGWDVALMPFARNEATRYISPTKTPEYLAAGKPVVSTSIRDVVRMYGVPGYVRIADAPVRFIDAVQLSLDEDPLPRIMKTDAFLALQSWDLTWDRMDVIVRAITNNAGARPSCLTT
jgi:UDP-galactopyranose mutase